MLKINKKCKKGVDFRACTRGCDVALGATWLCHVDTCACLHGTDVTWTRIYIYYIYYFIKYIGLPIIGRQIINCIKSSTLYTD